MSKRLKTAGCSHEGGLFPFKSLSMCSVALFAALSLMTPAVVRGEMPVAASELTSSRTIASHELKWHDNLESGWKEAKATGRPMVIFITSDQCIYCDAMKRDTLSDASVRQRLLSRFVPIRLRPDANNKVLSRISIPAYPTTLVAHPRGKVMVHRIGYQPVEKFHEMLSEVAPVDDSVAIR
ncbi:thioredoxin family protein [Aporhodopirellula aestuarii]|uniref:Thioredoxin family protein n=1 Tax=Aporhodopirellula aestuarii TaxID=2950107 RepID=A0ABT0UAP8_9BACT|nr:thioredoxin family protein [Aporhodopirellula aestuarii]MCM2374047.1 thioredoxin family protein [Aporhodopirellula aestuarii]